MELPRMREWDQQLNRHCSFAWYLSRLGEFTRTFLSNTRELVGSTNIGEMKKLRHKELSYKVPKVISRRLQKGVQPRSLHSAPFIMPFCFIY